MNIMERIKKGPSKLPARIMMIGVEGVGKSTAGAAMPNPIFVCGENGLVGDQFGDVNSFNPSSWAEVIEFVDELAKNANGFQSIVIDTLDWLEPLLYQHVVAKANKKDIQNIEDFGYGRGYVLAQSEARQLLARLDRLNRNGFGVLILAHSQIKTFNNPNGENFDRYEPKVNLKIGGLFREWCDCVLFAEFDMYTEKDGQRYKAFGGQNRIVHTTHSSAWDAKNRYGLPEIMPLYMPTILAAIEKGHPDDGSVLGELKALLPKLPEDKANAVTEWLKKERTPQQIAGLLNKCRFEIQQNNRQQEAA